jgi:hypothetical protein
MAEHVIVGCTPRVAAEKYTILALVPAMYGEVRAASLNNEVAGLHVKVL